MINLPSDPQNPNETLAQIQHLVDHAFYEPIHVGKIFGSSKLDNLCQEIGRVNALNLKKEKTLSPTENLTIYIASKLQASGGHTSALMDIIRLSPPSRTIVIITNTCGSTKHSEVAAKLEAFPEVTLEYTPPGDHLSKLTWLQQRLTDLAPQTVWLFNHHQDSVAVAAVQPNMGYRVKFYHHGDDRLCLGVHLNFAEHYDPHPFGFTNCRDALGIADNRYLPLVAADLGPKADGLYHLKKPGLVTCTAAGFNKVEVDYLFRYVDIVPKMLQVTGGRHIHFGRLTRLALWQLRTGLRKRGIASDAFVYIPYTPSVWRALHEYGVDIYVASFPYGAGRTLVEVMGAGVPVAIHSHCTSRMFGGIDMAYDDVLLWRDPEELYAFLRRADAAILSQQGKLARRWYERYHRDEIVKEALGPANKILEAPQLKPGYVPDTLMQTLLIDCDLTLVSLLKRFIWRGYRRLKSFLGRAGQ